MSDVLDHVLAEIRDEQRAVHGEPPPWLVRLGRLISCPTCEGRCQPPIWGGPEWGWTLPWAHRADCPDKGIPMPLRDPFGTDAS